MTSMAIETAAALDLSVLLGDWRNTNAAGTIARIVCEPAGDSRMRVHTYARSEPRDWGPVDAPVFAFTFDGAQAGAFLAIYPLGVSDHGIQEVRLQANVKAGVLVVVTLTRYPDDSTRSNYFDREFFYRARA
jgi:hypothetical protein